MKCASISIVCSALKFSKQHLSCDTQCNTLVASLDKLMKTINNVSSSCTEVLCKQIARRRAEAIEQYLLLEVLATSLHKTSVRDELSIAMLLYTKYTLCCYSIASPSQQRLECNNEKYTAIHNTNNNVRTTVIITVEPLNVDRTPLVYWTLPSVTMQYKHVLFHP